MESFYCLIVIPRLIVFLYSCVHIQPATDQLVLQYILPFPESYTHRGGRQEISLSGWVPVPKQIPLLQHLMFCHCQLSWDGLLSSSCLTTSAWTTIQDYLSKYCPKLVLLSLERGGEGLIPVFVYMYPHYTGLQSGRNTYSWFEHLRAPQVAKCCFWLADLLCKWQCPATPNFELPHFQKPPDTFQSCTDFPLASHCFWNFKLASSKSLTATNCRLFHPLKCC